MSRAGAKSSAGSGESGTGAGDTATEARESGTSPGEPGHAAGESGAAASRGSAAGESAAGSGAAGRVIPCGASSGSAATARGIGATVGESADAGRTAAMTETTPAGVAQHGSAGVIDTGPQPGMAARECAPPDPTSGSIDPSSAARPVDDAAPEGPEVWRGATAGPAGRPSDDRVGIEIRVALSTMLGLDDHPAELPSWGPILATDARRRAAMQRRAEWRFAVTDVDGYLEFEGVIRWRPDSATRGGPRGGIVELHVPAVLLAELLAGGMEGRVGWAAVVADIADQYAERDGHHQRLDGRPRARFPGAAPRRSVQIRDRTCTFPGCRYPAARADQDHTVAFGLDGRTVRVNLGALCPHDHDVKHLGGWRLRHPELGAFDWTSPLGQEYRTRGEWMEPEMPEPEPGEDEPWLDETREHVHGPILIRAVAEPPRPPPIPRPVVDLDEPPF